MYIIASGRARQPTNQPASQRRCCVFITTLSYFLSGGHALLCCSTKKGIVEKMSGIFGDSLNRKNRKRCNNVKYT